MMVKERMKEQTAHKPEASSTMRVLLGARCIDARLYTFQVKIGTNERSPTLALLNSLLVIDL